MKIHTGDTVVIISGKDKGKTGQVLRVLETKNRVVVSDINMRTKHIRSTPQRAGEIVRYEASIHLSNVMLVDPKTKKRTRVGYKVDEKTGAKSRIARKSGEVLSAAAKAKPAKTKKEETAEKAAPKKNQKAAKEKEETKSVKVDAPKKSPFWKRMGFGAEALEGMAEQQGASHMKEDHSVPDEQKRVSNRGSSRGS